MRMETVMIWKKLAKSNRVITLADAKHLLPSEWRAMVHLIARLNTHLRKEDRVYVHENVHMESIHVGGLLYKSLSNVGKMIEEYSCSVHIYDYCVYAGNKDIVVHLAKLDGTNFHK
jgi:hypothetical protein